MDDIIGRSESCAIVGWEEGSAGQIHTWIEKQGYHIACFVHADDTPPVIEKIHRDSTQFSYPENGSFKNKLFLCSTRWFDKIKELGITKVLVTTDDMQKRHLQIEQAKSASLKLLNAIHPTVTIMEDARIGENVIVHAHAFIGYRTEIGNGAIINTGAQLDHHNVIRECATIDPGVVFAGNVTVGRFTRVHTAATVINRICIGENCIIGAGSVIIKDVQNDVTVVGVPGRIIKKKGERV